MSLIRLQKISRCYGPTKNKCRILNELDLLVYEKEMLAIRGKSGSGKTTLLNILGGIDFADSGEYFFREKRVDFRNQNDAARFRRKHVGVIVQHFALLDDLSAYDNIAMALWAEQISRKELKRRVEKLMNDLGIIHLWKQFPTELSGGEKQRVAIARALIREPDILLADEPTGALDEQTSTHTLELLQKYNSMGTTIVVVTHDEKVANCCSRQILICDGRVTMDSVD